MKELFPQLLSLLQFCAYLMVAMEAMVEKKMSHQVFGIKEKKDK